MKNNAKKSGASAVDAPDDVLVVVGENDPYFTTTLNKLFELVVVRHSSALT